MIGRITFRYEFPPRTGPVEGFVAVADSRSFTRAATQLNRTQSAVSMQIKRLEERLGVELFNRTKANVDLSAAGEGLLGYARRILTLNDEAVGKLGNARSKAWCGWA